MNKKEIYFATGNKGKIDSAQKYFDNSNHTFKAIDSLELIEPQSRFVEEVSLAKVSQAYDQLQKPVFVQDGAFCIPSMGDLPGTYTTDFNESLKEEGYIKLIEAFDPIERKAYIKDSIAYKNGKHEIVFTHRYLGMVAEHPSSQKAGEWGVVWRIFKPKGFTQTLNELTLNEVDKSSAFDGESAFVQLIKFLDKEEKEK